MPGTVKLDADVKGKSEDALMIRIGDLAAQAGVSTRALRYYEEHGLLSAERSASGQRHYPESALQRVELIQHLYAAGLSSADVARIIPYVAQRRTSAELVDLLQGERERLDEQIERLHATRDRLDEVIQIATLPGLCG